MADEFCLYALEFQLIGGMGGKFAPVPFSTNCHNKHGMKARQGDKRKALQMEWKPANNCN